MKRFILLLFPITVLAVGCTPVSRDVARTGKPFCCTTNAEPSAAFTDQSLYQLDSTWTNDVGETVQLGALRGRVQVVAMFFASCAYACPIIVHDMKRIEAALPEDARARTGFTLITIDPERDTAAALHAYRQAHQLSTNRWTFLRASADDTLELAALLGVKFRREANGQFAHSNLITLLNAQGEVLHQFAGLNQDIAEAVKCIASAAQATSKPRVVHE